MKQVSAEIRKKIIDVLLSPCVAALNLRKE